MEAHLPPGEFYFTYIYKSSLQFFDNSKTNYMRWSMKLLPVVGRVVVVDIALKYYATSLSQPNFVGIGSGTRGHRERETDLNYSRCKERALLLLVTEGMSASSLHRESTDSLDDNSSMSF